MANTGSLGVVRIVENWVADNIHTAAANGIAWVNSSDTSDTAFGRAVAAGRGLHVAGALTTTENNMIELCHDSLFIYGQSGYAAFECQVMIDDVTLVAFNVGLNDEALDSGNTLPVELSGTTWTTTATTFLGLVFDTGATNDEVHVMWVDDGNDSSEAIADLRMKGASPQANKWMKFRIEIQDRGSGQGVRATFTFTQDGKSFEKTFNTSVDRDCALTPWIGFEQRAAPGAKNVYIAPNLIIEQSISD